MPGSSFYLTHQGKFSIGDYILITKNRKEFFTVIPSGTGTRNRACLDDSVTGRRLIVIVEIEGTSTEDGAPSPAGRYSRYMRANDLKEASGLCRNFILMNGIREDNWAGGYVFDGSQQIAYIMHTGKIRICGENGYRAISWKPR